jgi:hypothetical protein
MTQLLKDPEDLRFSAMVGSAHCCFPANGLATPRGFCADASLHFSRAALAALIRTGLFTAWRRWWLAPPALGVFAPASLICGRLYQTLTQRGKARVEAVEAVMGKFGHPLFPIFRANQPYAGFKLLSRTHR